MDLLWSPWRYDYIKSGEETQSDVRVSCVFCSILKNSANDEDSFILHRAEFNFVILNIYPYITGHLMVIPYNHVGNLSELTKIESDEMTDLTKLSQSALQEVYQPNGFNLGMNMGKAAGAGVAEHIHMHLLPRWQGDANFMTTIGQTRTIPEDLTTTFKKLKPYFI